MLRFWTVIYLLDKVSVLSAADNSRRNKFGKSVKSSYQRFKPTAAHRGFQIRIIFSGILNELDFKGGAANQNIVYF